MKDQYRTIHNAKYGIGQDAKLYFVSDTEILRYSIADKTWSDIDLLPHNLISAQLFNFKFMTNDGLLHIFALEYDIDNEGLVHMIYDEQTNKSQHCILPFDNFQTDHEYFHYDSKLNTIFAVEYVGNNIVDIINIWYCNLNRAKNKYDPKSHKWDKFKVDIKECNDKHLRDDKIIDSCKLCLFYGTYLILFALKQHGYIKYINIMDEDQKWITCKCKLPDDLAEVDEAEVAILRHLMMSFILWMN